MPRKARIDAPGALHHIIARGNERKKIFDDDIDREFFLQRLGEIIEDTQTVCLAWALIPNHFHLLLKTGSTPISTVMKRLLTGYAMYYNRRHHRHGHLFQNRYKSILCQEDTYLILLIRYIHLNPLRSKLVEDLDTLDVYPYSGHGVLMGNVTADWQNTDYVLKLFADKKIPARHRYKAFVSKGVDEGRRDDLIGGGLIRSAGGWTAVKALRKAKIFQKGDERILGDGDFVQKTLSDAKEAYERKYRLKTSGVDLDAIAGKVAELVGTDPMMVWAKSKQPDVVKARSLLCYWASVELGLTQASLSQRLGMSQPTISLSVSRGRQLVEEMGYKFKNLLSDVRPLNLCGDSDDRIS